MSQITPLADRLRNDTRDAHMRVEGLPFFTALTSGELPLASYVGFLDALSIVYEAIEQEMVSIQHQLLTAVWDDSLRKLPLIHQDLAYFQPRGLPDAPVAALRAQLLAQQVRRRAHDDAVSLLGYLYVLEGSTLGGLVLKAQLAPVFGLSQSTGLAYLSSYEKATKAHWTEFTRRLNSVAADEMEQARVVEAAGEAFNAISSIIESLYPFDADPPRDLVRTLNPEAGSHAIPHDAREIQAALRAGERSWRQFPYYQWRYGQRGEQFTRSDSAWLVTLTGHPPAIVEQQILWLGRVLSSRGMPRWMLELHLDILYAELMAAVPEKQASYASLQKAADSLRKIRQRHIGDDVVEALTASFDQQVGVEWSMRLPRTGGLLAVAVADEKAGITQAVTNIEAWMTDPARFPTTWIAAVQMTIQMARERAS